MAKESYSGECIGGPPNILAKGADSSRLCVLRAIDDAAQTIKPVYQ